MASKYLEKVVGLDLHHNIGLQRSEISKVVAKLEQIKADYPSEDQWMSAIDSIVHSIRANPLEHDIKKQEKRDSSKCPVCEKPGRVVSIMGGREVHYCEIHRVVSPMVKNPEE